MYKELRKKCKEYIEAEKCLGCNQLELDNFEGNDNCPYIEQQERFKENYYNWRIK